MVEVTSLCGQCHKEFVRKATTDEEVKELQRTIWRDKICSACLAVCDGYWD